MLTWIKQLLHKCPDCGYTMSWHKYDKRWYCPRTACSRLAAIMRI